MESHSLDECITLIKNGKKAEARQLLQSILQSDLSNLNGWYWYVETFDTAEQKVKALHLCLKYNPENQKVKDAIHTFEKKHQQITKSTPTRNTTNKTMSSGNKKNNKNLWIIGSALGLIVVSVICVSVIRVLLNDQTPLITPISVPTSASTLTPTFTLTHTPTKANTAMPFTGEWQTSTSKSEFDNSTTVALSLEAENSVEGWLTTTLPTLVIRCKEKEIDVYVNIGTQSDVEYGRYDAATVRVRFDQDQAFETIASESTDGEALFFRDPYSMIISMLQSDEMVFGFTPFNAVPAVTTFDLHGLANVIDPLKQSCNWNGAYPTIPPPIPTETPLPLGSALTISGLDAGSWKVEVEKIIVTKSVTSNGDTINANGQFVLVFLQVTNLGNGPALFTGFGAIQARSAEGTIYTEAITASSKATDMYGIPYGTMIQPDGTDQKLIVFDLPLNDTKYFLIPGILADDNGQSIVLEIPK